MSNTSIIHKTSAGLAITTIGVLALLVACTGLTARQKVLLPAMQSAWPAVKADLERGVPVRTDDIAAFDVALTAGDVAAIRLVPWQLLDESAQAGIAVRVTAGTITEGVAGSLRERLKNFREAVLAFTSRG
jgi:hypothetical protein